ncbi:hypothetical protein ON010_g2624 [Phytophthora cinnamomi]|nr:hypothetical protein ON010_g2624 [Phytophthora cinnamomi]
MRVDFIVVAALVTIAASAKASAESLAKTKYTITNPDTNATLDAVYVQDGDEVLVVHLTTDDDESASAESSEVIIRGRLCLKPPGRASISCRHDYCG